MVNDKLAPALRRAFPGRSSFVILIDNEKIMHTELAQAMHKKHGIKVLKNWPARSPDLNPQENVWPGVENKLRREAPKAEALGAFAKRTVKYLRSVASDKCVNYIRSMPGRIKDCIARNGAVGRR